MDLAKFHGGQARDNRFRYVIYRACLTMGKTSRRTDSRSIRGGTDLASAPRPRPALEIRRRTLRSERPRKRAAVDQDVLPGNVPRLRAGEIGAKIAELLGPAEALGRDRRLAVGARLFLAHAAHFRLFQHAAAQAVGVEGARLDRIDRDIMRRD